MPAPSRRPADGHPRRLGNRKQIDRESVEKAKEAASAAELDDRPRECPARAGDHRGRCRHPARDVERHIVEHRGGLRPAGWLRVGVRGRRVVRRVGGPQTQLAQAVPRDLPRARDRQASTSLAGPKATSYELADAVQKAPAWALSAGFPPRCRALVVSAHTRASTPIPLSP